MIVDALVALVAALLRPVLGLLPEGGLDLPNPTALASNLAGIDSLVPILGVLRLGSGMLAALLVFVGFRIVVFLRHFLLP